MQSLEKKIEKLLKSKKKKRNETEKTKQDEY